MRTAGKGSGYLMKKFIIQADKVSANALLSRFCLQHKKKTLSFIATQKFSERGSRGREKVCGKSFYEKLLNEDIKES